MVLNEIAWAFKNKHYTSTKEFNQDVEQYQLDMLGEDGLWKPDEVVADYPQIEVCYNAWIKSPKDLYRNEKLTLPVDEIFTEDVDEDEYQLVEIIARLDADNAKHFTASELLMKVHNAFVNKELGDDLFLEGVEQDEEQTSVPLYYIICGS